MASSCATVNAAAMAQVPGEVPDVCSQQPQWFASFIEHQKLQAERQHAALLKAVEAGAQRVLAKLENCEHRPRLALASPRSAPWQATTRPSQPAGAAQRSSERANTAPIRGGITFLGRTASKRASQASSACSWQEQAGGDPAGGPAGRPEEPAQTRGEGPVPAQPRSEASETWADRAHASQESLGGLQPSISGGNTPKKKTRDIELLAAHIAKPQSVTFWERAVNFVNGPFDLIMNGVICLNAFFMFVQTEWYGAQAGHSLGIAETFWNGAEGTFEAIEVCFAVVYTLELILRIAVLQRRFFLDRLGSVCYTNLFDLFLVLFTLADLLVMSSVDGPKLGVMRFLRMAKLARALRLVRVLKAFHQLRLLCHAIASSLPAFLWSMTILLVLNIVCGMILTEILHEFVMDSNNDLDLRKWVNSHYGSGWKAAFTMFEVTHSGCWPNYSSRLIDEVHPAFAWFWMLYVGAVIFAIIKIITAVFISETMKAAQSDTVTAVAERMRMSSQYIDKLRDVFEAADTSRDNVLTRDEFQDLLDNPVIKHYLSHLDLEIHDAEGLFDLLDDGDAQVTLSEFVGGITRMKGQARSADMVSLMCDIRVSHEQGKEILRTLHQIEDRLPAAPDGGALPSLGLRRH